MSDFSSYREKVANYGKMAHQAETDQNYELAYEQYTKALDIFMHMIKCKCFIHRLISNFNDIPIISQLINVRACVPNQSCVLF